MKTADLLDWFELTTFLGISMANWAVAIGTALVAWLVMSLGLSFALRRAKRLSGRTSNRIDDVVVEVLAGTNRLLIFVVSLLVGVGMLDLPEPWPARVAQLWFLAVALQVGLWGNRAIKAGLKGYVARNSSPGMTQLHHCVKETSQ